MKRTVKREVFFLPMAQPRKTIRRFSLQVFFFLALALALPLLVVATYYQTNIRSKAAESYPTVYKTAGVFNGTTCLETPAPDVYNKTLSFGSTDSTKTFTIEGWFKKSSDPLAFTLISNRKNYDSPPSLSLQVKNNRLEFSLIAYTSNTTMEAATISGQTYLANYPSQTWNHVAVVRNNGTLRLFLNGKEDAPAVTFAPHTGPTVSLGELSIGCLKRFYKSGSTVQTIREQYFVGRMDEVRVSNKARYSAPFTPPTFPFRADGNTMALWHFDDTPGSTSIIDSGYSQVNPAKIYGTLSFVSSDIPFAPTITPTPTLTPTPAPPTPTNTPSPSPTPTPQPPTATPVFTMRVTLPQTTYTIKESPSVTVNVQNYDGSSAVPAQGFNVQAYIVDSNTGVLVQGINPIYNAATKTWKGVFAPITTMNQYRLRVSAYCGVDGSYCTQTYGHAKQIDQEFIITVAKDTTSGTITCSRMICPNGQKPALSGGKCVCKPAVSTQ